MEDKAAVSTVAKNGSALARQSQARVISAAMARKGLRQADIVKMTGLKRYTVSRICSGRNLANSDIAALFEQALELPAGRMTGVVAGDAISPVRIRLDLIGNGGDGFEICGATDSCSRLAIEAILQANKPMSLATLAKIVAAVSDG